jgi:hypothetical protein
MTTKFIGTTFPDTWLWSEYENQCIDSIMAQIDQKYTNQNNLFINLTWFGPQFDNNGWSQYQQLIGQQFDNLFLLSTVDPAMINPEQIAEIVNSLGNPKLFKLGNFDTEYHFNFFAPILTEKFKKYTDDELLLTNPTWLYINYNRKPRRHRVELVNMLRNRKLDKFGIITLGKPNIIYDNDSSNELYLSIGEQPIDYVEHGHWFSLDQTDEFGIPHDVLSLHNIKFWKEHFLYIIGATEFNVWDDIFVSETQFKPIIGLRPFLINGNVRTYQWLESNGFKTFNRYFDWIDFTDSNTVHASIIEIIVYLTTLSQVEILNMYNDMLPDLIYNKERFFEFAKEQQHKIENIFK